MTILAAVESDLIAFVHQHPELLAAEGAVITALREAAASEPVRDALKALVDTTVHVTKLGIEAAIAGIPVVGGIAEHLLEPVLDAGERKADALAGAAIDAEAARLAGA